MSEPFLGEIKLVPYNFAPQGWAFAAGQILSIAQNTALFALIGTMYGGDGQTTFALPDLQGRAVLGEGQGPGLSPYVTGQRGGTESVTLNVGHLPSHGHTVAASSSLSNQSTPTNEHIGTAPLGLGNVYGTSIGGLMPANAVGNSGQGLPHENRQPFLAMYYIIALEGIFPSRS